MIFDKYYIIGCLKANKPKYIIHFYSILPKPFRTAILFIWHLINLLRYVIFSITSFVAFVHVM